MSALRRVSVMAEERNKPVKLSLLRHPHALGGESRSGRGRGGAGCPVRGEELAIGFNSRYVLEALTPIEKEEIVFEFKDGLSPGVVKSVEDEGYCCVIMPMRI